MSQNLKDLTHSPAFTKVSKEPSPSYPNLKITPIQYTMAQELNNSEQILIFEIFTQQNEYVRYDFSIKIKYFCYTFVMCNKDLIIFFPNTGKLIHPSALTNPAG